jgi:hypothetical protein
MTRTELSRLCSPLAIRRTRGGVTWFLAILLATAGMSLLFAPAASAQEEEEVDPLGGVIVDMQVAGGRLSKLLTDKPTRQKQRDAVDKLDALIRLLEQRRQQGAGQVNANPDKPADESTIRVGPGGSGPLHDANRNGRGWGQLPAHKREQILQSMNEGFPPHYQQLLERYYRRLAEEKPAGEATDEEPVRAKAAMGNKTPAATAVP